MIVLDTNVVSETFRPRPDVQVLQWIGALDVTEIALAAPSVAELFFGVEIMPEGRNRHLRRQQVAAFIEDVFVLPFDLDAAQAYASLAGNRRKLGMPIGTIDGQIAAIASAHSAAVATRNVPDFIQCGIEIINPWEA